jgi:hypothetical protein
MQVFVPLTDDALERLNNNEQLVPYRPGLPLCSQAETPPEEATEEFSRCRASAHPRVARPDQPPCPR